MCIRDRYHSVRVKPLFGKILLPDLHLIPRDENACYMECSDNDILNILSTVDKNLILFSAAADLLEFCRCCHKHNGI